MTTTRVMVVGASTAQPALKTDPGDAVLVDIIEGLPKRWARDPAETIRGRAGGIRPAIIRAPAA